MPRRDGSGPLGQGPMTGRGRGICRDTKGFYDRPINSLTKAELEQEKIRLESQLKQIEGMQKKDR